MRSTDLRKVLLTLALLLTVSACSSLSTKDDDASDAAEVAERAEAALGDDGDESSEGKSEKPDAKTKPKQQNLPMVLAPGVEKDAKAARTQYDQAMLALKSGNDEQALVLLRDISNRHPNLSGPLLNQAILLRKKGRLEEAQKLLKKSMMTKTQNPRIMNELGVVSRQLGNFQQAKTAYESAIRLAPGYDKPHYNLAILADVYLNDLELAIKEFEMYQSLQSERDKKVDGWLKDLRRRAGKQ